MLEQFRRTIALVVQRVTSENSWYRSLSVAMIGAGMIMYTFPRLSSMTLSIRVHFRHMRDHVGPRETAICLSDDMEYLDGAPKDEKRSWPAEEGGRGQRANSHRPHQP